MAKPYAMHTRLSSSPAPLASALRECAVHVFPDCAADLLVLDVPTHEPPEQTWRPRGLCWSHWVRLRCWC